MPRGMNNLAREFHDWLVGNEYGSHQGTTNGGHQRYRLRNGHMVIASTTPSAYTSVANAKAYVRKQLGIKSDSPQSGKYSHKKTSGFDGRVTKDDHYPMDVEQLKRAIRKVDSEMIGMRSREDVFRLRNLAKKRLYLAEQLQKFGVVMDPPRKTG